MHFLTNEPQNLMNHSPKYEEMMTMHLNWRLWHQNWITPKISVTYIFSKCCMFSKCTLRVTSIFNLRTLGWLLFYFKSSKNKITRKTENHHFDTWGRFLPGRSHMYICDVEWVEWSFLQKFNTLLRTYSMDLHQREEFGTISNVGKSPSIDLSLLWSAVSCTEA